MSFSVAFFSELRSNVGVGVSGSRARTFTASDSVVWNALTGARRDSEMTQEDHRKTLKTQLFASSYLRCLSAFAVRAFSYIILHFGNFVVTQAMGSK